MKHFCSLSEAIREGAKLRPQAHHGMLLAGGTCAMGAAAEAIGFSTREIDYGCYFDLLDLYPYARTTETTCPVVSCGKAWDFDNKSRTYLGQLIVHLNDDHRWTREAIADWLESEEEKLGFVTVVESESSSLSLQSVEV